MKVMVACSAGGHWVQMRRILPAFDGFEIVYVGVEAGPDPALGPVRYYRIANVTRRNPLARPRHPRASSCGIVRAERPDVVVTTGAGPGAAGARGWPSSPAAAGRSGSIPSPTPSGCRCRAGMARPVADAWLVQWEHLARPRGPHFWGAVL